MTLPAQVIDLRTWKLTLPIGSKGHPTEVKQPDLAAFTDSRYFHTQGDAVAFRAPVNGVTTSGSPNPRSELREMRPGGDWSSTDGQVHAMVLEEAFTHLPNARTDGGTAGVVGGQIHDANNDICVFRLEGAKLWVTNGDNTHFKLADADYRLGTRFTAMFVVEDGVVEAYYNGLLIASIPARFTGGYFKAGAYTQANSSNSKPSDVTNYGEVLIYRVTVSHGAAVPVTPPPVVPPTPTPVPVPVPVPASATKIQIIRHGEKPSGSAKGYNAPIGGKQDSHSLTKRGWARAVSLVELFTGALPAGLSKPTVIYAADGPSAGARMLQTVSLLAADLQLTPNLRFDKGQESALATELKALPAGAQALVCWEHSTLPVIGQGLGTVSPKSPSSYPSNRFDLIWIYDRLPDGTWKFSQTTQPALPKSTLWAKLIAAVLAAIAAVVVGTGPGPTPDPGPPPTPIPTSSPAPTTSTPVPPPGPGRAYPWHTNIVATTFWVGEIFDASLPDGSQVCSTYDSQWAFHWSGVNAGKVPSSAGGCQGAIVGGCDGVPGKAKCATETRHPENDYFPVHSNVVPRENPFYLDLPFDDINDSAGFKTRCTVIPWAGDAGYKGRCADTGFSFMKNRWVRIVGPNGNTCYGQIEDAGPSSGSLYHDSSYVFGANDARPANTKFGAAGADVSPALNGCLGFAELDGDTDHVKWQFVDAPPPGPWTKLVTTSGVTP